MCHFTSLEGPGVPPQAALRVLTGGATGCDKAEGDFDDYFYDFYKVFVAVDKAELEKGLTCLAVAMGEQRCFPYRHTL